MLAEPDLDDRGNTLLEVVTALAVSSAALLVLAQLFGMATRSNRVAREVTYAAVLGAQKMEQLRGALWAYDSAGGQLTDTSSDFSSVPEEPSGGSGLLPSPSSALTENTPGFVDYLDESGRWVGTGRTPPPRAAYIRRWSIEPLPADPADSIVLQVLVISLAGAANAGRDVGGLERGAARLVAARTRRMR
jgi:type II secretory pathway pseudopilin PulG